MVYFIYPKSDLEYTHTYIHTHTHTHTHIHTNTHTHTHNISKNLYTVYTFNIIDCIVDCAMYTVHLHCTVQIYFILEKELNTF